MQKLTWEDVDDMLEHFGYSVNGHSVNEDLEVIEASKFSPAGQDCIFEIECRKDNPASVVEALTDLYENYDVDEEAARYIGPDGHPVDGAPQSLSALVGDMQSVKDDLENTRDGIANLVETFDFHITKEDVGENFLNEIKTELAGGVLGSNLSDFNVRSYCKSAMGKVLYETPGNPRHKKEFLNEYLKEIGVTDYKNSTFVQALNKELSKTSPLKSRAMEIVSGSMNHNDNIKLLEKERKEALEMGNYDLYAADGILQGIELAMGNVKYFTDNQQQNKALKILSAAKEAAMRTLPPKEYYKENPAKNTKDRKFEIGR